MRKWLSCESLPFVLFPIQALRKPTRYQAQSTKIIYPHGHMYKLQVGLEVLDICHYVTLERNNLDVL